MDSVKLRSMKRSGIFKLLLAIGIIVTRGIANATPIPQDFNKDFVQFIFNGPSATNLAPMGSGFLVGVKHIRLFMGNVLGIPINPAWATRYFEYYVTAKHVLQDTNGNVIPEFYLRWSVRTGGVQFVKIDLNDANRWRILTNSDPAVDLAVIAFAPEPNPTANWGHSPRPFDVGLPGPYRSAMLDGELIKSKAEFGGSAIREGNEMFFIGLFTPFYGSHENIPICRFGRLAMLSPERIPFENGKSPQFLYLMETEVFGGNSGSPAFFYSHDALRVGTLKIGSPSMQLAGIVKGYFGNWSPGMMIDAKITPLSQQNVGVAAIIPAYQLHEIIFSEQEKKIRSDYMKRLVSNARRHKK